MERAGWIAWHAGEPEKARESDTPRRIRVGPLRVAVIFGTTAKHPTTAHDT